MTTKPFDGLPPRATHGGYVYVIAYSSGTVKVGNTQWPIKRFTALRRDAEAFDIRIEDWWISTEIHQFEAVEDDVLGYAEKLGGASRKREYFQSIDFDALCKYAARAAKKPQRDTTILGVDQLDALLADAGNSHLAVHSLELVSKWTNLPLVQLRHNCRAAQINHVHAGKLRGMTGPQIRELLERVTDGGDLHGDQFMQPYRAYRGAHKQATARRDDERRRAAA